MTMLRCPHGRRAIIQHVDVTDGTAYPEQVAGTYECPAECHDGPTVDVAVLGDRWVTKMPAE